MIHSLTTPVPSSPALNTRWLRANLSRHLWHDHEVPGEIVDLAICQAWDARKKTTVLYELALRGADNHIQRQTYVGYQPKNRPLVEEYQSLLDQADTQPPLGRAVTLVEDANLVLVAFPNDGKMRLLSENELHVWVERHLSLIFTKPQDGRAWKVRDTKLEVLRYIPDKRFTIRCRVTMENDHGGEKKFSFIVKQFNDSTKARKLHRNLASLRSLRDGAQAGLPATGHGPVESNKAVRMPRDIAFDKTKALVFMEDLPGRNLKEVIGQVNVLRVMQEVGELLARFHLIDNPVSKCVSMESEVREVRETLDLMLVSRPSLRPYLEALSRNFESVKGLDEVPSVLLHGSYRLNHILIHNDELALLDLDSLRMGHPAYDVANFLSSLYYFEIQGHMDSATRKDISRFFLEGYARAIPWSIPPVTVLWYLTSLLINKQAHKYVTHFHEDQKDKVGRVLKLAEVALKGSRHAPDELTLAGLWRILP